MFDSSVGMSSVAAQVFEGAIVHPELYLWDSWSSRTGNHAPLLSGNFSH